MKFDLNFYRGKRVFITGHTGFKGSWLCRFLLLAGAEVTGYALKSSTSPSLFELANIDRDVCSVIGDILDYPFLKRTLDEVRPEIVIHMAAQPLVRYGYKNPRITYETNVMGTVNILESIRTSDTVRSFVNVTTDKVYRNNEWIWGYRECDELDGYDPYSNSKSCSDLVTQAYHRSFFFGNETAVSIVRAGNVIGGGDFASDRVIPDCVRAATAHEDIVLRNAHSIRPYQHVLDPLFAYLMIASGQIINPEFAGVYNVGPAEKDYLETGMLADLFVRFWGNGLKWVAQCDDGPHEANFLKLDCSKLKAVFGWYPRWNIETAVAKTVEWSRCWLEGGDVCACMDSQIQTFLNSDC